MSSEAPIRRGDCIRILAGTFEGFEAVVVAVDAATAIVSAEIRIFGRATPVEVPLDDAQRISRQDR